MRLSRSPHDDADPDETVDDPADSQEQAAHAEQRPWPVIPAVAVGGAVVAALAVLAVVLLVLVLNQPDVKRVDDKATFSSLEKGALAAARQEVVKLTTLSPKTAKAQVKSLLGDATGSFRKDLSKIASQLEQAVVKAKVTTQGKIVESGVQSTNSDQQTVTVLVAASQQVKNASAPDGEPRSYRMTVTMQRTNGKWLVANMAFVP